MRKVYCLRRAGFADPDDPAKDSCSRGAVEIRRRPAPSVTAFARARRNRDLVFDVVIGGHDRDYVVALIFPNRVRCQGMGPPQLRQLVGRMLAEFAETHPGTSTAVRRAVILDDPPAIDAQELTEKGSVNQKAVLRNRAAVVEQLFAERLDESLIEIREGRQLDNAPH